RIRRRERFDPMRPRPTIPSCTIRLLPTSQAYRGGDERSRTKPGRPHPPVECPDEGPKRYSRLLGAVTPATPGRHGRSTIRSSGEYTVAPGDPGRRTFTWLRSRCMGRVGARTAGGPSVFWV